MTYRIRWDLPNSMHSGFLAGEYMEEDAERIAQELNAQFLHKMTYRKVPVPVIVKCDRYEVLEDANEYVHIFGFTGEEMTFGEYHLISRNLSTRLTSLLTNGALYNSAFLETDEYAYADISTGGIVVATADKDSIVLFHNKMSPCLREEVLGI